MIHLSDEQLSRYIARSLSGPERLALSDHLASCPLCRQRLARSTALQFRSLKVMIELTGMHTRRHLPGRHAVGYAGKPAGQLPRLTRLLTTIWSAVCTPAWRPLLQPGVAALAGTALLAGALVVTFFLAGRDGPKDRFPGDSRRFVSVNDHGRLIRVGQDGTFAGLESLIKPEQAEPVRRVLSAALNERPLPVSPELEKLRAGASATPEARTAEASLNGFGPAQTLVSNARPEFRWPTIPGASGYVLHIVEDKANREVYRSGTIAAGNDAAGPVRWALPEQARLSAGVVYRWYVTAITESKPLTTVPAAADEKTKFAVIFPGQASALAVAKQSWGASGLAGAALDLHAGLLDEAEAGFRRLRDDASQTPQGRALLDRLIASVQQLRANDPQRKEGSP